ncbi:hypothetical protein PQC43_gp114 [Escherichia phage vB_EcoP-101114UKE3]|uniref:Uncharacterized protein n=1 Tax=Escherichia phage vB_EcoP-101114UKE3 TaxID=2865794 RepID=A0AAE7XT04_9CAUD|nr:hypothetical protein PQC43_gp114 [Escherichia phage vB_EcoP-101114UKE3]QZI79270.1 hypothetical protein 101114UKE3_139 [Escherichia phage vB_EcoP-101114UKE3]USM81243.1 hypothetical protein 101114BS3_116 [Escherichia phage vB_EcoP-101114BS3]
MFSSSLDVIRVFVPLCLKESEIILEKDLQRF